MEQLLLGVAREIITPKVGGQLYGYNPNIISDKVEDDLTATAFYFQQADKQALMISVTVCLIQSNLAARILDLIENTFAIPRDVCMLCATHTHSGPNTQGQSGWGDIDTIYCETILIPKILEAVRRAKETPIAVQVGAASGKSYVGINRRELNDKNIVKLGQCEWGCFNPKMTVISFRDLEGKNIANMIHYGAHGTAAGENTQITRDWSGVMTDTLEGLTGGITAFFNGPEGDVGPRLTNGLTVGEGDIRYVYELGHVAARDAVSIYRSICSYRNADLLAGTSSLNVPLKSRMSREDALKMHACFKNDTVNLEGWKRTYSEMVIHSYDNGYQEKEQETLDQTLIQIGDQVFVTFPYELFSEIGMRINQMCENVSVLSLSNSNGSEGYFVTQDQICRGGYEVHMFSYGHIQPYCDDADWSLIQQTVKNIKTTLKQDKE